MAETFQDFMLSKYAVAPYRICADLPVHVLEDEKGHLNEKGQSLPCAALYLLSFLQGTWRTGEHFSCVYSVLLIYAEQGIWKV